MVCMGTAILNTFRLYNIPLSRVTFLGVLKSLLPHGVFGQSLDDKRRALDVVVNRPYRDIFTGSHDLARNGC